MNRKGFTLIELMAVILVISIILVTATPSLYNVYKNSKLKSEEIFIGRLSNVIDSYIKLNNNEIKFVSYGEATKKEESSSYTVSISKGEIKFQNILDKNLLSSKDFINSGNKEVSCNINANIEVYKDSDYVYCYKVKKDSLGCLSEEYQDSTTGNYVIDTCIWE